MKQMAKYLAVGLLGGFAALGSYKLLFDNDMNAIAANETAPAPVRFVNASPPESSLDFTYAAEQTVNSVVHVKTEYVKQYVAYDPFRDFFGYPQQRQEQRSQSSGSGVIISDDGYIVTNNHVVAGASKVEIVLNDGMNYDAEVIGLDPATDLALLKIDETGLPYASYGNSDDVRVGQWVLAVGNPFNLTSTVTAGIVSAKARSINILEYDPAKDIFPIESFIQTDAAVNPGNSGGALVDASGKLIGINSAIASNTGSYTGYSFAIPVTIVKKVTRDLLEFGEVQRAFIGVNIRPVDENIKDALNLNDLEGVYVAGLVDGGAAASAGLEEGDVIMKVGNVNVNSVPELQEQVGRFRPGDKVMLTILRNNSQKVLPVTLRNKEGNTELFSKPKDNARELLGATLEKASTSELKALKLNSGVKVKALNSGKLRSSGVKEGFIITKLDGEAVREPEQVSQILTQKSGGILIEGYYPNGVKKYYGFGN